MSYSNIVFEYLKLTRKSVVSELVCLQNEDIKEKYETILNSCIKDNCEIKLPKLIICETYNKYSQVWPRRIKNQLYEYYILYDLHLEKVLNTFVKILLSDEDPAHDVWKLSYELFSEEMIIKNNQLLYLYYKLNDIALGDYYISINKTKEMSLIYDVHSNYVLAHEVGHWLYCISNKGKEEEILNLSDYVENVMNNSRELLREVYDIFERKFQDKDYSKLISEQKRIVCENDRIIEECFADAVAYSYVVQFVNLEYRTVEERLIAVEALFILMMSMQILSMSQMTFNDDSFENSISVRITFLREYLLQYYEDISHEYFKTIEMLVERFENRITNIILESFAELENRGMNITDTIPDWQSIL